MGFYLPDGILSPSLSCCS